MTTVLMVVEGSLLRYLVQEKREKDMEIFILVVKQMMTMMLLICLGFLLRKKKILPQDADKTISKLETWIFVPALSFITQLNNCTVETFKGNYKMILYGSALILTAIVIATFASKLFVRNAKGNDELMYQRNIYKYGIAFANHGFMGCYIVLGVWGDDMLSQYNLFRFLLEVLGVGWGLYVLIPKDSGAGLWTNVRKSILNPPVLALTFGIIGGLLGVKQYFPDFALNALDNASKCMGPCAMLLAGVVIGGYELKKLFANKKVYVVTFLRLVVFPTIFVLLLKAVGIGEDIQTLAFVAFACPIGMNSIVFPAAYGADTKTGASMTVISSIISIITIPVMYYLLIQVL